MRRIYIFIVFLVVTGFSQGSNFAGDFLEQGVGVRAAALGQAYSATAEDLSALYYNPAGISLINSKEVYLQYTDLYTGLAYQHFIGYNHPLFAGWSIGAGWMRVGVDGIQKTEIDPQRLQDLITDNIPLYDYITGDFSNYNDVYYLSVAKNNAFLVDIGWQYFEMPVEIPIGIAFKYINQSLDEYAGSGLGFDFGGMLRFRLSDFTGLAWMGNFSYSFTVKDFLGTGITWNTDSKTTDEIPFHVFHGVKISQPIEALSSEIILLLMHDTKYGGTNNWGFEYSYDRLLSFRAGYRNDEVSLGAGVRLWMFNLDYAYLPHDLGNSHRVALQVRF
jgi:hypothetical protein